MADVVDLRERVTRSVYESLADRSFRECLTAEAPDGSHPILIVLPADPIATLLDKLDAVGGCGNVVMPKVNGFVVVAMQGCGDDEAEAEAEGIGDLTASCTVGVFIARLFSDAGEGGAHAYRFVVDGQEGRQSGRAELVALGR